jgi:prophage regulatory protein
MVPMGPPRKYVGASEIARLLGVTRQRVQQLINEPGFPLPDAALRAGRDELKMWDPATIRKWAAQTGRVLEDE